MADLQGADRGLAGVARLQCGDHAAALVAQAAPFVELVRVPGGDEPAVAGEERQFGGERTPEAFDEDAVLAEPVPRLGQPLGQRHKARLGQHAAQRGRLAKRPAQRREVARAAAPEAEPRQGPLDVGAALQPLAHRRARSSGRSTKNSTASSRAVIARGSVSGAAEMLGETAGRPAAVTVRSIVASEAAPALAGKGCASSRLRRVAASICMTEAGVDPPRRLQMRRPPCWVKPT